MVIDPNGQVSVSYFDMAGRVIATALAGQNPAELMPLLSEDMQDTILKTEARQLTAVCLYASKIACGEALKQLKKVRQSFDCQIQTHILHCKTHREGRATVSLYASFGLGSVNRTKAYL